MSSGIFGHIFTSKQKEKFVAKQRLGLGGDRIKPANDILEFEYPPESSFYKASDTPSQTAGELHPNL